MFEDETLGLFFFQEIMGFCRLMDIYLSMNLYIYIYIVNGISNHLKTGGHHLVGIPSWDITIIQETIEDF